jgi:hypothetical protein
LCFGFSFKTSAMDRASLPPPPAIAITTIVLFGSRICRSGLKSTENTQKKVF